MGLKQTASPVFFISLVGVDKKGKVDDHEGIFDIYTKKYEFTSCDVVVKSAQDLWDFYEQNHPGSDKEEVDIYTLVEYFVQSHPNAHYVLDEVPFLEPAGIFMCKYKIYTCFHFQFNSCIIKL